MYNSLEIEMKIFYDNSVTRAEINSNLAEISDLEHKIKTLKDKHNLLLEIYDLEYKIHGMEYQLKLANDGNYFSNDYANILLNSFPSKISECKEELNTLRILNKVNDIVGNSN